MSIDQFLLFRDAVSGVLAEGFPRPETRRSARRNRGGPMNTDMSGDEFRRFGHEVVDWIADYLENNAQSIPSCPR
jgi:hypothetical protein